ncbi:hypothetical protein [Reichenbachiella ulvae]|uniref:SMODS and SLOG-associating 2TM effector domain-containing protein n=1 Tax=Reichenbachiella ulvae TaxID=2980104 RepID=A0ABT3CUF2_9BACT|nr:hypothetical protein [Reichenbachiella ulvae]MCV9387325.1 hypothetical protein [Reichenbachiella ulvae]
MRINDLLMFWKKRKSNRQEWRFEKFVEENYKNLDIEFLKFSFDQAEKLLIELDRVSEQITDKAHKILGIAITILIICFGYIFSNESEEILTLAAKMSILLSLFSLILLIRPLWSYETHVIGSSPSKIMGVESLLKSKPENQLKNLLYSECQQYQTRITFVSASNNKRHKNVNWAMIFLLLIPLTLIASRLWFWCI